ncbi:MAG: efflux RND transporter periplasmic adaptor subunit [Sedimentisphaerales bacterium]|nr:efflux RND transporter periplasmic adaptor subunit [Sedimentisphaerales bacterium]
MSEKSPEVGATKKNHGWFRRNIPKLIIIIAAIIALSLIAKLPERQRSTEPEEAAPVNVSVMTVVSEPEFADTFILPAVVEPNRIVTVSAEVQGRIERIPLTEGSKVRAGNLLVRLNADLIKPQVAITEAQVERDQIEFERMKDLVEMDATSQSDFDDANTQLAVSKAQLKEIRASLERTDINAPINGVLNDVLVEEGEYVQPGTPVAEIVDIDTVKIVVDVPERDISFFTVGAEAEVFFRYRGDEKSLTGTITFISELADQQTRCTSVEITLQNKQGLMRSGQIVRVQLTRRKIKDAILIPLLAVIPMENSNAVYVVNSKQAQRREVKLGIYSGDRVRVISGLEPGDKLIIAGHRFVAPGQKVNIVEENK